MNSLPDIAGLFRSPRTSRRFGRAIRLAIVNSLAMSYCMPFGLRNQILRWCGYEVGRVTIFARSIFRCDALEIGDGSFVNHGCLFDIGDIHLGTDVYISSGVTLATGTHRIGESAKRAGSDFQQPIRICDGAWVGANVTVLSGVTIREGCVIGAGAVVVADTTPNGVYVGVPAKRIKSLPS